MKKLNLAQIGVQELTAVENREIDGGIIPLLIIGAAAVLLTSCTVNVTVGDNNSVNGETAVDSTANGNSAGTGSGNSVNVNP